MPRNIFNDTTKDDWGRIEGMSYRAGKNTKKGWYYNEKYVASQLRDASKIIRKKLKGEPK